MMEKPAPCVLWSWTMLWTMAAVPLSGALAVATAYLPLPWRWPAWIAFGGGLVLLIAVYLPLRRRRMGFALTDDGVEVTGGVWFTSTRRMHREAIRQVTLLQGPIERRQHTAFLLVSGTGGYLLVEGVGLASAEDWCRRLYPR